MKYIKTYESYNVDGINWDLIQDAKDIALEYLDEYYVFNYYIMSEDDSKMFYGGVLSHDKKKDVTFFKYNGESVKYKILMTNGGKPFDKNLKNLKKETDEVINRLRSIYPNENIVGLGSIFESYNGDNSLEQDIDDILLSLKDDEFRCKYTPNVEVDTDYTLSELTITKPI